MEAFAFTASNKAVRGIHPLTSTGDSRQQDHRFVKIGLTMKGQHSTRECTERNACYGANV